MVKDQSPSISHRKMPNIIQSTINSTLLLGILTSPAAAFSLNITPISTFSTGIFDDGAAEISTFDPLSQRLFVTNASSNQVDVLDFIGGNLSLSTTIPLESFGATPTSIASSNGLLAVSVANEVQTDPGTVAFFDTNGHFKTSVKVGALPDAVTFTPNGRKLLVANEAEPVFSETLGQIVNPKGSVSIIDLLDPKHPTVRTADFSSFSKQDLENQGVQLFVDAFEQVEASSQEEFGIEDLFQSPITPDRDLQPENITVSDDGKTAWVALQENNAIGVLNLETNEFTNVVGLGVKDHSQPNNGLDTSDRDDAINIENRPVFGLFQPDQLDVYTVDGITYLVTANEGDFLRIEGDLDGQEVRFFQEDDRIDDLVLDPTAFPDAIALQEDNVLGRLQVSTINGDPDGDGDFDELFAFGGRSFSIWKVIEDDLELVFDSGDAFEQITADLFPDFFNAEAEENNFDNRSDNRGPEPQGIKLVELFGRTFAFIGFEQIGGFIVYDVTDPENPFFVNYINNRDFLGDPEAGTAGDLGPEGLLFISAEDSPNDTPMLVVNNEVSGTTTVYSIEQVPEPSSILGLLNVIALGCMAWKRKLSTTCKETSL
ncbi:hypothetical protein BJP34_07940 [Moorena producens PAL-8-15-08-1]|uniref:Choice-of-anchor I domain-containing protein n=2 Tax=Moorena TaxID=1155738 RepID=A0A1D8TP67_9CYAN|nr:hypothetical protein BJP34_07940 [Moorena producens PAL-8-15-08-1]